MGGSRRSSPPARQVALLRPVALSTAQLGCAAAVAGACALPTLSSPSAQAALSRVRRRPGSCAPRGRGPAAILPRAQPRRYRGGGGGRGGGVCTEGSRGLWERGGGYGVPVAVGVGCETWGAVGRERGLGGTGGCWGGCGTGLSVGLEGAVVRGWLRGVVGPVKGGAVGADGAGEGAGGLCGA